MTAASDARRKGPPPKAANRCDGRARGVRGARREARIERLTRARRGHRGFWPPRPRAAQRDAYGGAAGPTPGRFRRPGAFDRDGLSGAGVGSGRLARPEP